MKKTLLRLTVHAAAALVVVLALMSPAYFFQLFSDVPVIWFQEKYFWIFCAFGIALAGCPRFSTVVLVLGLFGILELTQFGNLAFSGEYITPFSIGWMFVEFLEVFETASAHSIHFIYVPLIIGIPYALGLFTLRATWNFQYKSRWFTFAVILFLLFPLIRIKTHSDRADIVKFFPKAFNLTLINTLNSYSVYFGVLLPERLLGTREIKNFQPYQISETEERPSPMTIVLIMGESLTPRHMSIFGYERPTTPFLDSLVGDPDFVYSQGFSAANATRSSLPMFYTVQYHPLDQNGMQRQDANLFKLAKNHQFSTYYMSAQNSNCLNGVNLGSIDRMITSDIRPDIFKTQKDDGLLQLLKEVKLAEQNFIVIHQRNIHLPYKSNTEHRPAMQRYPVSGLEFKEANINAYDNAVHYADYLYQEVINEVKSRADGPVYFFITSDHGEQLGENGHWGHDQLNLLSPAVPLIFYGAETNPLFTQEMKKKPLQSHYQMGKKIAALLGYEIHNPEEEDGIIYVNGIASFGRSGYMQFRWDEGGNHENLKIFR
jgi:glucan phosphoethanolaminetransferase (alkaline phosphatase superfamily)